VTAIPTFKARPVQWRVRAPAPLEALEAFSRTLGLPPKLAAVLYARGIHSADALEPPLELNPNPALLEAATRIIRAMDGKKRIRIHGDYDADGITGAAVLTLGLRALGANVHAFIPHRLTDGYGVHPDRVPEHLEACDLFITVDCGVSNLEEIGRIVAGGAEAIVTDHHAPGHELPGCLVVHPALAPNYHHDLPGLTGSGVAFHLLWAVHQLKGEAPPLEFADLAAIGTIADLAPLLGENRALVKAGLAQMRQSRWTGIRAMLEQAKISTPNARDVGFVIAPRINAAGRLGEADVAMELLTTESASRALTLATYLDARNIARKKIQDDMFTEALEICDPDAPALVVTKDGWHPGVMGIVASKLLERYYKPVFIIAAGKGSVRSTPGISAVRALTHASSHLKRFGGHTAAGGFALADDCIPGFRDSILEFARQHPTPVERVTADALLEPSEVTEALIRSVASLEPFGQGNPAPLFWVREMLQSAGSLGKEGKHFQYKIGNVRGKQWGVGVPFSGGDAVDAAVQVEENTFGGRTNLEFTTTKMRYQGQLSVLEEDLDDGACYVRLETKSELERLKSVVEPLYANAVALDWVRKNYPGITIFEDAPEAAMPETLTLIAMPEAARLEAWIRAGVKLRFALTERTLGDLEHAERYPLEALRLYERHAKKGMAIPTRARELLDEVRGLEDVDVYRSSGTVLRDELETYRAVTFARFYRAADDAGFTRAVKTLYGGLTVERVATDSDH
jgi:single-stranded-DNA-specific exonuclease